MAISRYLTDREKKLAKLLGEIANMEPEAWARVQKSFDKNVETYYNTQDRIMT